MSDLKKRVREMRSEAYKQIDTIVYEPITQESLKRRLDKILIKVFDSIELVAQEVDKLK